VVTLDVGTTKNNDGRTFPMTPELPATLEAQRAVTETRRRMTGTIIPWAFHRAGQPMKRHQGVANGLPRRGLPGRIPHDFRRTVEGATEVAPLTY
jgi:integrase